MSEEGISACYVNSHSYVHDIVTLSTVSPQAGAGEVHCKLAARQGCTITGPPWSRGSKSRSPEPAFALNAAGLWWCAAGGRPRDAAQLVPRQVHGAQMHSLAPHAGETVACWVLRACHSSTSQPTHCAGYAWQCAYCACGQHLGWKFTAVRPGLAPPSFWGLRRPALQAGGNRNPAPRAGGFLHGGDASSEDGDGGWTSGDEEDEEDSPPASGGSPASGSSSSSEGGSPGTAPEADEVD